MARRVRETGQDLQLTVNVSPDHLVDAALIGALASTVPALEADPDVRVAVFRSAEWTSTKQQLVNRLRSAGYAAASLRDSDATVDADALLAALAERLARFKLPRRVVLVDALPRTALGKVQRRALAQSLRPPGA